MGLIYMAKNKINGHMYIGKTDYTLEKRKKQHIQESKREKRRNKISGAFHIALVKYGEENFEWIILEDNIDKTMLNDKEKYYIKKYNTYENKEHYNLTPGGDGGKFDESVRQKISKKNTGRKWTDEQRKRYGEIRTGGKQTEYQKQVMRDIERTDEWCSKISTSLKGKPKTEQHKQKLSKAKTKKIKLIAYNENEHYEFTSYKEAHEYCIEKGYTYAKIDSFRSSVMKSHRENILKFNYYWHREDLTVETKESSEE